MLHYCFYQLFCCYYLLYCMVPFVAFHVTIYDIAYYYLLHFCYYLLYCMLLYVGLLSLSVILLLLSPLMHATICCFVCYYLFYQCYYLLHCCHYQLNCCCFQSHMAISISSNSLLQKEFRLIRNQKHTLLPSASTSHGSALYFSRDEILLVPWVTQQYDWLQAAWELAANELTGFLLVCIAELTQCHFDVPFRSSFPFICMVTSVIAPSNPAEIKDKKSFTGWSQMVQINYGLVGKEQNNCKDTKFG